METLTHLPSDPLSNLGVHLFWSLEGVVQKEQEAILPKGFTEIVFNFSDTIQYYKPRYASIIQAPKSFISGVSLTPNFLFKSGVQAFLGMQLHPYACRELLGLPCYEITDKVFDLNLLDREFEALWERLAQAQNFITRVNILSDWAMKRLCDKKPWTNSNPAIHLYHQKGTSEISVKKLSTEYFMSERNLQRICKDWLGMNTETVIRYKRYIKALHLLHEGKYKLTDIALSSGYYDQSHFIHEFRSFTGMQPKVYRKNRSELPGHIYGAKLSDTYNFSNL